MGQTDDERTTSSESEPKAAAPTASRRLVLKVFGVTVAGAAVGVGTPIVLNQLSRRQQYDGPWKVLTAAEAALLAAVCEQIIPTDKDPGAKEAGCVNFIDKQLAGPYRRFLGRYRDGLAALQATSQSLHDKRFEELAFDDQTKLLEQVEAGRAPNEHWKGVSSAEFFRLVCGHTMQGFYGSPRHGGNKDYVSYKMLGVEYPRVIGRNTGTKV
jgi:gluconate 2-dehydrogenase gamma chain